MSNAVKGAGPLPKMRVTGGCARSTMPATSFCAEQIEGCVNCRAMWEPFDPAQILDAHRPTTSSFKGPAIIAFSPRRSGAIRPGEMGRN